MKLYEALKKRKKGEFLYSHSCAMYRQKPKNILFWLFSEKAGSPERKHTYFKDITEATDWEIGKEIGE